MFLFWITLTLVACFVGGIVAGWLCFRSPPAPNDTATLDYLEANKHGLQHLPAYGWAVIDPHPLAGDRLPRGETIRDAVANAAGWDSI